MWAYSTSSIYHNLKCLYPNYFCYLHIRATTYITGDNDNVLWHNWQSRVFSVIYLSTLSTRIWERFSHRWCDSSCQRCFLTVTNNYSEEKYDVYLFTFFISFWNDLHMFTVDHNSLIWNVWCKRNKWYQIYIFHSLKKCYILCCSLYWMSVCPCRCVFELQMFWKLIRGI